MERYQPKKKTRHEITRDAPESGMVFHRNWSSFVGIFFADVGRFAHHLAGRVVLRQNRRPGGGARGAGPDPLEAAVAVGVPRLGRGPGPSGPLAARPADAQHRPVQPHHRPLHPGAPRLPFRSASGHAPLPVPCLGYARMERIYARMPLRRQLYAPVAWLSLSIGTGARVLLMQPFIRTPFFFVVVFALFHWGLERKGSILLRESGNIRFLFRFVFFFLFVLKKKGIRAPFGEVRFHSTGTRLLPFVFLFLKKIQFEWRLPWNFWEEKRTKPSRIDWDLNAVSSRLGHWNKRLWSPGTVTIHRFVSYSLEEFQPNRVDPIRSAISMEPQRFRFQHPPYWTTVRVSKRRRGCFSLFVCCFVV